MWITFIDGGWVQYYTDCTDMNNLTIVRLIKNGTSLVVVIPKNVCAGLGAQRGDLLLLQFLNPQSIVLSTLSDKEILQLKKDGIVPSAL